ncbi:MAG: arginine N-succinyltransferase, partial [Candidatus Margulisiibacteriota bacterium]
MNKNESYILRHCHPSDAKAIYELSKHAKSGLSNLPKTLKDAKKLVAEATKSLSQKIDNNHRKFIFILESNNKEIIGISGIKARTGIHRAYYSFDIKKDQNNTYLKLKKTYNGPSELGSLFLMPKYREKKIGKLLSLSRFLFIKRFPDYFSRYIIAELRGFLFKNNVSPVWNAIGKKFIPLTFHQADIKASKDERFIEANFPRNAIYLNLISKDIQHYFKQVHPYTMPAKKLLIREGFQVMNQIDIFDGGPTLKCKKDNIKTINLASETTLNK